MISKRRKLTELEESEITAIIETMNVARLTNRQRDIFISIKSQFEADKRLSDKQIETLCGIIEQSHKAVYGKLLSQKDRIEAKLNIFYNPMKNGPFV